MAAQRFLCDEHVSVPVYRTLVNAGHDVIHLLESELAGATDPLVLHHARRESRILLTRNYRDFAPLVAKWSRDGTDFPGVLFISNSIPQADAGAHLRALSAWLAGPRDVRGTYGWLG